MVCLKPPALRFFLAAAAIALFLPYAFVPALFLLLFVSAVAGENSMLLGIKNGVTKGKNPERNGKGLAGFASGLFVCGLVVCILSNCGVPTVYGMIDGESPKEDTAQTDHWTDEDKTKTPDTPSDGSNASDSKDVIVSSEADVKEAAKTLTDKLIAYAGNDRSAFEKLFRNTESAAVDQYYNTSYDTFKAYGKSLIAIAAEDGDSVWFTALYYQIPTNYPAEKEKSVYLSTIMTRGANGWKIEWNDDVRARLQEKYADAGSTYDGREAKAQGYAWAKFFIPFDIDNTTVFYEGAVMCKVTEMYMDINNNLQLTLYVSNGTNADVGLTNVDLTMTDGDSRLFGKKFDLDRLVVKGTAATYTLTIPSEELSFNTWSTPKISDFTFAYTAADG